MDKMNQFFSSVLMVLLLCLGERIAIAQNNNEIFSKLLSVDVQTESKIITQLLNDEPGKKIFADSNHDGKVDVLYMIDPNERHETQFKPILVKIVDEDGDMYLSKEGDLDSDLHIADWNTDGTVDRIIDYVDLDSDNDQDEQIQYFWSDSTITTSKYRRAWYDSYLPGHYPGKNYYICWAKDVGDDNRLWEHINYDYVQTITQWMSDYNGDETLVNMFFYDYKEDKIIPIGETTFSFYDLDNDKFSEEALRFVGKELTAENLRYSCDIDNDAGDTEGATVHDYDFSVSCIGPIAIPQDKTFRVKIREYYTEPIVKWAYMRDVAKAGKWKKSNLTWDENDNNISDPVYKRADFVCSERWEGVINHPSEFMERVGGPSCGFYNKRNEVDMDYSGGMQFYYSPVDQRFHLYGAEVGWIKVDYDNDHFIDMFIWMEDENKDGFFDTWKYDVNGDCLGKEHDELTYYTIWKYEPKGEELYERVVHLENDVMPVIPFDYWTIHDQYAASLSNVTYVNQILIDRMKKLLRKYEQNFEIDTVEDYFNTSLAAYRKDFHIGEKIKNSNEGTRYYLDIIRERYWQRLTKTDFTQNSSWQEIYDLFNKGSFEEASDLIRQSGMNLIH